MTITELKALLDGLDIPVRYGDVPDGTALPFAIYTYGRSPLLVADNKVYAVKGEVQVDVYCNTKTELDQHCTQLEEIFDNNDIIWDCVESHSIEESYYLNTYNLEV